MQGGKDSLTLLRAGKLGQYDTEECSGAMNCTTYCWLYHDKVLYRPTSRHSVYDSSNDRVK